MPSKNRVTINLTDEEYTGLVAMAKRDDRSLAWLGRQAIKQFISVHGEPASQGTQETPAPMLVSRRHS